MRVKAPCHGRPPGVTWRRSSTSCPAATALMSTHPNSKKALSTGWRGPQFGNLLRCRLMSTPSRKGRRGLGEAAKRSSATKSVRRWHRRNNNASLARKQVQAGRRVHASQGGRESVFGYGSAAVRSCVLTPPRAWVLCLARGLELLLMLWPGSDLLSRLVLCLRLVTREPRGYRGTMLIPS